MPIIRVEMWSGRTEAQKAELARVVTQAVVTIVGAPPEATIIIFEDIPKQNWAVGGELASQS